VQGQVICGGLFRPPHDGQGVFDRLVRGGGVLPGQLPLGTQGGQPMLQRAIPTAGSDFITERRTSSGESGSPIGW
jgi:hypothetical protein